jgi:hypothetical protein
MSRVSRKRATSSASSPAAGARQADSTPALAEQGYPSAKNERPDRAGGAGLPAAAPLGHPPPTPLVPRRSPGRIATFSGGVSAPEVERSEERTILLFCPGTRDYRRSWREPELGKRDEQFLPGQVQELLLGHESRFFPHFSPLWQVARLPRSSPNRPTRARAASAVFRY